jgi:transcriptional antiterminator RfaH
MEKFQKGWYLLYTKPRHEKKLYERLNEMNISSFLPMCKKLRQLQERRRYVNEPLFPSYLFIYLNDLQNYYNSVDTDGALYYVRVGKKIVQVNESVIHNIRLLVNKATEIQVYTRHFSLGQRLVICEGPLTGLTCELIQVDKKNKLLVRMDMLGRNVLVSVPEENLLKIS